MRRQIIVLVVIGLLAGVTVTADTGTFIRMTTQSNGVIQLETCIRHYKPADGNGPEIYLAGVAHIGDTNYYTHVQKHLDAQKLVMFEGVGHDDAVQTNASPGTNLVIATVVDKADRPQNLQGRLASSLGLVFQLDAIDYNRPHFRHNDISLATLKAMFKERNLDAEEFIGMISSPSDVFGWILSLLTASRKSQALVKLTLIETLAGLGNDIERMASMYPDLKNVFTILLAGRNATIFRNLQAELAKKDPAATISLFYGAAHMKDLAARIEGELRYRAAGEEWIPAFRVDPKASGITDKEIAMIRGLLEMVKRTTVPPAHKKTRP